MRMHLDTSKIHSWDHLPWFLQSHILLQGVESTMNVITFHTGKWELSLQPLAFKPCWILNLTPITWFALELVRMNEVLFGGIRFLKYTRQFLKQSLFRKPWLAQDLPNYGKWHWLQECFSAKPVALKSYKTSQVSTWEGEVIKSNSWYLGLSLSLFIQSAPGKRVLVLCEMRPLLTQVWIVSSN